MRGSSQRLGTTRRAEKENKYNEARRERRHEKISMKHGTNTSEKCANRSYKAETCICWAHGLSPYKWVHETELVNNHVKRVPWDKGANKRTETYQWWKSHTREHILDIIDRRGRRAERRATRAQSKSRFAHSLRGVANCAKSKKRIMREATNTVVWPHTANKSHGRSGTSA